MVQIYPEHAFPIRNDEIRLMNIWRKWVEIFWRWNKEKLGCKVINWHLLNDYASGPKGTIGIWWVYENFIELKNENEKKQNMLILLCL